MVLLCKRCAQANPADASYCYHDGSPLASLAQGPLDLAQAPFAEPFHFPTGEVCNNFDQLALACQMHWREAQELLRGGVFEAFLGRLGRTDLMRVAREAAAQPNADAGVDYFLSRLPTRNLAPPRLHIEPVPQQLGTLKPGHDLRFTVKLVNHGHRLISGTIVADCPWLEIEGATHDRPKLLQFPYEQSVVVRVAGNKLFASQKPLEGMLYIATDAGLCEIPITCTVPILPFPNGVMQGCRTPRELAHAAKHHPDATAELFFNGAVKEWYASNGWTYPVEGEPASGKAAVQQFFEALGLTRPPLVVLDTSALGFQGMPGQRLTQHVEVHSDEKRPIFAFGRSLSPWLTITGSETHGTRVQIAVEANVPNTTLTRLEGQVEVRANGSQRFRVKVVLQIEAGFELVEVMPRPVEAMPVPAAIQTIPAPTQPGGGCLRPVLLGCGVLSLLLLAGGAVGLLAILRPDALTFGPSPLKPYMTVVSPKTCAVAELNLAALGQTAALEQETTQLQAQLAVLMRDLDVQTEETRPARLFVALEPEGPPLLVWTYAAPVKLGKPTPGRFEGRADKGVELWVDRFDPGLAWAVDAQGRLLNGTAAAVREALARGKSGKASATYAGLVHAASGVTADALAWAAGDFHAVPAPAVAAAFGGSPPFHVTTFHLEMVADSRERHSLHARGTFPSAEAAALAREGLRMGLPPDALPFVPATLDLNKYVLGAAVWEDGGRQLDARVTLHPTTTSACIQVAALNVKDANHHTQAAVDEKYRALLEPGIAAEKAGHLAQAVDEFERVALLFPNRPDAKVRAQRAAAAVQEQEQYRSDVTATRDALEKGNLDAARATLDRLKKSRFADEQVVALAKDVAGYARTAQIRAVLKEAEGLLASDLDLAQVRLQAAYKLDPANREAADALSAVKRLGAVQQSFRLTDEQLRDQRPDLAQKTLTQGLAPLLKDDKMPAWRIAAYKARRERLLEDGARLCNRANGALQSAAGTARQRAERLITLNPTAALEEYETALVRMEQARTLLDHVQRIKGEESVAAELRDLDKETAALRAGKRKVGGLSLLEKGKKTLEQAQTAAEEARRDPATIPAADALASTALKCFREAEQLKEPGAATQVQMAEDLKSRLERILHPVTLNPAEDLARADWSYTKSQWTFKEADGKVYLQAQPGEPAALESKSRDWPVEFELDLEFAIVDPKGKVYNSAFSNHPNPLTLVLNHVGGTTTSIALGKDNVNQLQPFACLQYNREQHTVENLVAPTKAPLHLVLRCKRREGEERPTLAVLLGGKEVCSRPLPREVDSVRLRIATPMGSQPRFVAIYGMNVEWTGAKEKTP